MRVHGLPVSGGEEATSRKASKNHERQREGRRGRDVAAAARVANGSRSRFRQVRGPSVKRDSYAVLPVSGSLVSPTPCTSFAARHTRHLFPLPCFVQLSFLAQLPPSSDPPRNLPSISQIRRRLINCEHAKFGACIR